MHKIPLCDLVYIYTLPTTRMHTTTTNLGARPRAVQLEWRLKKPRICGRIEVAFPSRRCEVFRVYYCSVWSISLTNLGSASSTGTHVDHKNQRDRGQLALLITIRCRPVVPVVGGSRLAALGTRVGSLIFSSRAFGKSPEILTQCRTSKIQFVKPSLIWANVKNIALRTLRNRLVVERRLGLAVPSISTNM